MTLVRPRLDRDVPGSEGILAFVERGAKSGKMAQENTGETVVCNPVDAFFRVGRLIERTIRGPAGQVPVVLGHRGFHLAVISRGRWIVEVLLAHSHPDAFKDRQREWQGQAVPPPCFVDRLGNWAFGNGLRSAWRTGSGLG